MAVPDPGPHPARTAAALIAAVERSPRAAADHDRLGWVGLFAADGSVEDPVGSRPHRRHAQIARFYDTFIGPRDITFHRGTDVVSGFSVLRDLTLEVRMGTSVTMTIPAYLRYDLGLDGDGNFVILRLRAFWELPAMVGQFARNGLAAVPVGLALGRALLRNQGLIGAVGFGSGFRGVGKRGKRELVALLADATAGDEVAVKRRLASAAHLTRGDDERLATSEFVGLLAGAHCDGMIAAGRHVVSRVTRGDRRFLLVATFDAHPMRIRTVGVFLDDGAA